MSAYPLSVLCRRTATKRQTAAHSRNQRPTITRLDNGSASIALATRAPWQSATCARLSIKYANYANYAALLDLFVALFGRQEVAILRVRIRNSVWAWHSAIA